MIIDAIVSALASVVAGIGDLFGAVPLPGWLPNVSSESQWLVEQAAGFGNWFPIGSAVVAIQFLLSMVALAFGIWLVRIVLSLFTGGGGAA